MSEEKKQVLVIDFPSEGKSWVRDAFLKVGGEVINVAGYEPDFVAYDEAPLWPTDITQGRMQVTGTLTAYFYNEKLMRKITRDAKKALQKLLRASGHWISAPRKWKRNQRKLQVAQYGIQPNVKQYSRGYRKHIRRMKARGTL